MAVSAWSQPAGFGLVRTSIWPVQASCSLLAVQHHKELAHTWRALATMPVSWMPQQLARQLLCPTHGSAQPPSQLPCSDRERVQDSSGSSFLRPHSSWQTQLADLGCPAASWLSQLASGTAAALLQQSNATPGHRCSTSAAILKACALQENASKPEGVAPNQGGKYVGFGSTPGPPPKPQRGGGGDDITSQLAKGFTQLSTVAGMTLLAICHPAALLVCTGSAAFSRAQSILSPRPATKAALQQSGHHLAAR